MKFQNIKNHISAISQIRGNRRLIVVLVLIFAVILMISLITAKFINSEESNKAVRGKHFYFNSDLLDGETHNITATENGTASISLQLRNHEDNLRFSEVEIKYTVSVTPSDGITVNPASGTIQFKENEKTNSEITISGMKPSTTYTVTAEATEPYKKTITGKFYVNPLDNNVYGEIIDEGSYIEVALWTKDYSGTVSLTYPSGLTPDNTNTKMSGWVAAESGNITKDGISLTDNSSTGANSSCVLRFFKTDTSKKYSIKNGVGGSSPVEITTN